MVDYSEHGLEEIVSQACAQVADSIKTAVGELVQRELSSLMGKALIQGELHRHLNEEMRQGLHDIFHEISLSTDSAASGPSSASAAQKIFSDASEQIDGVMQTVLVATEKIMEKLELLLDKQEEARSLLASLHSIPSAKSYLPRLEELNRECAADLTEILPLLSFQDLTGQRLIKLIHSIDSIKEMVFDLYMSTGLMLKQSDEFERKGIETLKEESARAVAELKAKSSTLKGPVLDVAQKDVDELLASLGV